METNNNSTSAHTRRKSSTVDETLTMRDILDTFLNNWGWFLFSVIVALALSRLYLATKSNVYQRQAVMLVKDDNGSSGGRRSSINTDALM